MYKNRGLTGIVNLGNTCYMNSAIQCLSNTIELTDFFLTKKYMNNINTNHKCVNIVHEWYRLLEGIWSENCTISPNSFNKLVKKLAIDYGLNLNFSHLSQNDVHEFLIFLIDNMHEVLSKKVEINITGKVKNDLDKLAAEAMKTWKLHFKDNYSKIIDLFYGQLISTIETSDNVLSRTYDPTCFFMLPIPNNKTPTIYDCFDLFCASEELTGDNKYKCDKTNEYYDAKKSIRVWTFPKILIVCFKRFTNIGNKIVNTIDFPLENLNLNKYCDGYKKYKSFYNLYGICNHSGSLGGGHYYAYCKNTNGQWYNYNDSTVTKIEPEDLITKNAYCLFYKKRDD